MQTKKREKRSSLSKIIPSNKKGDLSIQMMIVIILGIAVLVFAIIWIVSGGELFSAWFPSNNVETIVSQCSTACATNSKYDYCSKVRTLKDEKLEIENTCAIFSMISGYNKYGVEECSAIDCGFDCGDLKVEENLADVKQACADNEDDITSITSLGGGQKCCVTKVA